jgi:hypothetical protein
MTSVSHRCIFSMIIGTCLVAFSGHAQADDWLKYYGKNKGIRYYYDGRSVKGTGTGVYQLWSKGVEHDAHGAVIAEQPTVLLQVDCRNNSSGVLGIYKNGILSRVRPGVDLGLPEMPEAASKSLRKVICK